MRILLLSPHTDDVELGAGASVSRFVREGHEIKWIAFSSCESSLPSGFAKGQLRGEFEESAKVLGIKDITCMDFSNRTFLGGRQKILDKLIEVKKDFSPELILCPSRSDLHQDHQVVFEEAFRAFKKSSSILGYEEPWNNLEFKPSFFQKVTEEDMNKKLLALSKYETQGTLSRNYFDEDFIKGLGRVRDVQCNSLFAEAFEVYRWIQ